MIARAAALPLALIVVMSCARDRSERPPQPPQQAPGMYPPMTPGLGPAPPEATQTSKPINIRRPGRPRTDPAATASSAPAPSAVPSTSAPAAPPPADLFRAQDACLDRCDQFACMKIAEAYRAGSGVPVDVLAGRRYAIHACLECGAPGLAIVDQCPAWGVGTDAKKKP